ncbi:IS21-like element helper ATPase IstB [Cupriavidus necator]
MMMHQTLTQLRTLKLDGFADGLEEQLTQPGAASLSFEERLSLLVDREASWRDDRRRTRLLKQARLKYPQAAIEDLDTRSGRGVDSRSLTSLALGDWVEAGYSLLISGPTGAGKSWLACALAQYACRRGHSALYLRVPRLAEELRVRHGNGGFTKWLLQVARVDVLLLDDWGMAPLDAMVRNDLLEMIDDRAAGKATIVTSQLPIEHWHSWIGDETIADAMLDRLMQRHHRITLTGESLRKASPKPTILEQELDQN